MMMFTIWYDRDQPNIVTNDTPFTCACFPDYVFYSIMPTFRFATFSIGAVRISLANSLIIEQSIPI